MGETFVGESVWVKSVGEKYMIVQSGVKSIWVRNIWVKDGGRRVSG